MKYKIGDKVLVKMYRSKLITEITCIRIWDETNIHDYWVKWSERYFDEEEILWKCDDSGNVLF